MADSAELGGSTSHAAVVSRELGLPAVVGCGAGTLAALAGTEVTVDGGAGIVYAGVLPVVDGCTGDDPDLAELAGWFGTDNITALPELLANNASRTDARQPLLD
jgi:pyruvate,orthophosphate dikinase